MPHGIDQRRGHRRRAAVAFAAAAAALLAAGCGHAQTKGAVDAAGDAEPYVWYDGERARRAWLVPDLIAEFPAADRTSTVGLLMDTARPLPDSPPGATLWRVREGSSLQVTAALAPAARISPVFRDSPGGRLRALPGNVIVRLSADLSEAAARARLAGQDVRVLRRLPGPPNTFLIETPPGLASLEIANRLYRSGEVEAASPDWWEQIQLR